MRSPFRSLTSALGGVVGTKRVRELGYARARVSTVVLAKEPDCSEIVPASARAWTPVPYSSFSRNEGVLGSSPGVGSKNTCKSALVLSQ
jgi:hypothetical protein